MSANIVIGRGHVGDARCGQFRLGNRKYCYPLTITDHHSCYLLACEGLESTREHSAFAMFEHTFKTLGLPQALRTDHGIPFATRVLPMPPE